MTPVTFWQALRRRAWIAVLCTAIAAAAMGAITLRSQPRYTSTATEATAYYQELAAGHTVPIQATIDQDRADLNKRYLDASQALLAFDQEHPQAAGAKGADPALGARRLALQLAQQAAANAVLNFEAGITQGKLAQITTIRNFESHVLDQAAALPHGGPSLTRLIYIGGLGLLLGIVAVFLLEYFGRSIDKPED